MLANKAKLISHQFVLKHQVDDFNSIIVNINELSDGIEALLNSNEVKTLHQAPTNTDYMDLYYHAQVRRPAPAAALLKAYNDAVELGYYDSISQVDNVADLTGKIIEAQAYWHIAHGLWQDKHTAERATDHRHVLNALQQYSAHIFYSVKLGLFN